MFHRVPQEEDEMLHFALSLVPLLNKLSGLAKLRATIALLEGLHTGLGHYSFYPNVFC